MDILKTAVTKTVKALLSLDLSKRAARAAGYEILLRNQDLMVLRGDSFLRLEKRATEVLLPRHLRALLDFGRVNCVIDVGANHGQYGMMLRALGYTGHIISFEPIGSAYRKVQAIAVQDPKWTVHNLALGSEKKKATLNVTQSSDFSSFLVPNSFATTQFKGKSEVTLTEDVQIERLDDLYQHLVQDIQEPRVFLKVDTQGYDLEVFEGARRVLKNVVGLQSEVSVIPIYQEAPDYLRALETFQSFGFELTGLFPICRDEENLRVIEYDCLMVRSRRPPAPGHV